MVHLDDVVIGQNLGILSHFCKAHGYMGPHNPMLIEQNGPFLPSLGPKGLVKFSNQLSVVFQSEFSRPEPGIIFQILPSDAPAEGRPIGLVGKADD